MTERIVIDTGPLITFSRIRFLDIVGQLPYDFICPTEVRTELEDGEALGHPRVAPSWLETASLNAEPHRLGLVGLDRGEAAVIELALEQGLSRVAIDEWKGRRAALASGLQVVGSLGLLGKAKSLGLLPSLKPLNRMCSSRRHSISPTADRQDSGGSR